MTVVTLSSRISTLRRDLEALSGVKMSAGEAGELTRLKVDLDSRLQALSDALGVRTLLADAGLGVSLPASYEPLRKKAQALAERFDKDKRSEVLKKGQTWRAWLEQAKSTAKEISAEVRQRWQAYESEAFTGDAPGVVEKRLAPTAGNKAALRTYREAYEGFRATFRSLPTSKADVATAKAKGAELAKIAASFDFDVPAEVKAFLEAVQSGGAPLQVLTPNVIEWLKQNKSYDHYRIAAQRQP